MRDLWSSSINLRANDSFWLCTHCCLLVFEDVPLCLGMPLGHIWGEIPHSNSHFDFDFGFGFYFLMGFLIYLHSVHIYFGFVNSFGHFFFQLVWGKWAHFLQILLIKIPISKLTSSYFVLIFTFVAVVIIILYRNISPYLRPSWLAIPMIFFFRDRIPTFDKSIAWPPAIFSYSGTIFFVPLFYSKSPEYSVQTKGLCFRAARRGWPPGTKYRIC